MKQELYCEKRKLRRLDLLHTTPKCFLYPVARSPYPHPRGQLHHFAPRCVRSCPRRQRWGLLPLALPSGFCPSNPLTSLCYVDHPRWPPSGPWGVRGGPREPDCFFTVCEKKNELGRLKKEQQTYHNVGKGTDGLTRSQAEKRCLRKEPLG